MSLSPFKQHRFARTVRRLVGAAAMGLLVAMLTATWAAEPAASENSAPEPTGQAEPQGSKDGEAPAPPIEIRADRLISDRENNLARFEGNVKATQGDTSIEADRLEVHYKAAGDPQQAAGMDALSKITASGNVRIKFDNRLAVTDEAVYITDQRILTLTGFPARVTSGQDKISGQTITFYRDSGRVEVQGGDGKPVEAIFHSGEKGIQ